MNEALHVPEGTVTISVVDSHTGGEPTRVVIDGFPHLEGTLPQRSAAMSGRYRRLATAIVDEPRGNEPMVGALLTTPVDEGCVTGVIFFDRALVLGMCGHGTIGVIETLHRLGRIAPGEHRIETPAGIVPVLLTPDGVVTFDNVVSRVLHREVVLDVPSLGRTTGQIAYGGNVFFLVESPAVDLDRPRSELLGVGADVMNAAHAAGFIEVDHVELYGPPTTQAANSRNFVLCPSGTYDRSPCGTGTSAKVAALAAAGRLAEDELWVQESITGSTFSVRYRWADRSTGSVVPTVSGTATVTGRAELFIAADEYGV